MDFVDDIHLIFGAGGCDMNFIAQLADLVDPAVAGGVDFDDI